MIIFCVLLVLSEIFLYTNGCFSKVDQQKDLITKNLSLAIQTVTFCNLANNPVKYKDKIVRLNSVLTIGIEGSWFSDAQCGIDNAAVISSESQKVWAAIEEARNHKGSEFLSSKIELVVYRLLLGCSISI